MPSAKTALYARIDRQIYERLREQAKASRRSMAAELEVLLEGALEP